MNPHPYGQYRAAYNPRDTMGMRGYGHPQTAPHIATRAQRRNPSLNSMQLTGTRLQSQAQSIGVGRGTYLPGAGAHTAGVNTANPLAGSNRPFGGPARNGGEENDREVGEEESVDEESGYYR
jgi:hypothetical protein